MTEDETADLKLGNQVMGRSLLISGVLILATVIVGPIGYLLLGPVFTKVLLMAVVSPLAVWGWACYRINAARIAEGKTSLVWGRIAVANHRHSFNQGLNLFITGAGLLLILMMAFVNLRGH